MRGRGARERILATATALFYAKGIRAVGVDLVASRAKVTKTTLYRHFPSKERLVAAFLERINAQWRAWLEERVSNASADPAERVLAVFDALGEWFRTPEFRGCPFVNTAAEAADPDGVVGKAAWGFKRGFRDYLRALVVDAGSNKPDELAEQLLFLADGAIVITAMSGEHGSAAVARRAARALLAAHRI